MSNYLFHNEQLFVCHMLNASYTAVYFAFNNCQTQSRQLANE